MQKTRISKKEDIQEKWFEIDARGKRLGTVASVAAELLLGKTDPNTRAYLMPKTKVVILNASALDITETKKISKLYTNYSGFPGGLKTYTLGEMLAKSPSEVIRKAVRGMLPRGTRGREILTQNLYIYDNAEHDHEAHMAKFVKVNMTNFKI